MEEIVAITVVLIKIFRIIIIILAESILDFLVNLKINHNNLLLILVFIKLVNKILAIIKIMEIATNLILHKINLVMFNKNNNLQSISGQLPLKVVDFSLAL